MACHLYGLLCNNQTYEGEIKISHILFFDYEIIVIIFYRIVTNVMQHVVVYFVCMLNLFVF